MVMQGKKKDDNHSVPSGYCFEKQKIIPNFFVAFDVKIDNMYFYKNEEHIVDIYKWVYLLHDLYHASARKKNGFKKRSTKAEYHSMPSPQYKTIWL